LPTSMCSTILRSDLIGDTSSTKAFRMLYDCEGGSRADGIIINAPACTTYVLYVDEINGFCSDNKHDWLAKVSCPDLQGSWRSSICNKEGDVGHADGWIPLKTVNVQVSGCVTTTTSTTTTTIPPADNSSFVSQFVPNPMCVGRTYQVTVIMKNTGGTTWTAAKNYRLGSQNPQDNTNWSTGRAFLSPAVSIAPGQNANFTFNVVAPASAGNYNFQWRMLREGVAWFGETTPNVVVSVNLCTTTTSTTSTSSSTTSTTSTTTVPLLPDLLVSDIRSVGDLIVFDLRNSGGSGAALSVSSLRVDGDLVMQANDSAIGAGVVRQDSFVGYSWVCDDSRDVVTVCADVTNLVLESNESNNCLTEVWNCPMPDLVIDDIFLVDGDGNNLADPVASGSSVEGNLFFGIKNIGDSDVVATQSSVSWFDLSFNPLGDVLMVGAPGLLVDTRGDVWVKWLGKYDCPTPGDFFWLQVCADAPNLVLERSEDNCYKEKWWCPKPLYTTNVLLEYMVTDVDNPSRKFDCSIWTNVSGSWSVNLTVSNVRSSETNQVVLLDVPEGMHGWTVNCSSDGSNYFAKNGKKHEAAGAPTDKTRIFYVRAP
jgi:hypothetical protein